MAPAVVFGSYCSQRTFNGCVLYSTIHRNLHSESNLISKTFTRERERERERERQTGHDEKTSWYGSNRNGVAGSLRSQQSTQKPALFATRSLAVYSRRNMILKPPLSFAGPREYRWQGLEVPAMMGKRRGTAQITTASPAGCAASNRHKNLLFSQLARSLCTAGET